MFGNEVLIQGTLEHSDNEYYFIAPYHIASYVPYLTMPYHTVPYCKKIRGEEISPKLL